MADEPKQPDDIKGILSELDAILSDLGTAAGTPPKPADAPKPAAPPSPKPPPASPIPDKTVGIPVKQTSEPPPPAAPPPPANPITALPMSEPPRPAAPPPPAAPPRPAAPPPPRPAAPPPPAAPPRPAAPPPPAAPPRPAAPPPPPAAPPPAAPPAPAAPVPSLGGEVPAGMPKEQIRRVAYLYTFACAEARKNFSVFLTQVAKSVSKKPLFLREVMSTEVAGASDPEAIYEEAAKHKVVAVLAIVEGWPPQRVDAMAEACSRGGMLFRSISPADVQKKSAAVDIIVDMMLLPGERDG